MRLLWARVGLGLFLLLTVGGCREIPSDRLYALHLDQAPTAADWERALPRQVWVRGGRLHKDAVLPDVDEDTVHTSTASCHHGASLPDPVAVDMRAFYTDTDLYLRLSWLDRTRDDAFRQWTFDGENWRNGGGLEDGFGLMWDARGDFSHFSCSYACHIDDFGVNRASFHAQNRMKLDQPGPFVDLWNWKAGRTGRYGFADDRYIDHRGMHGDLPGDLFRANSRVAPDGDGDVSPFGEGDAPLYDSQGGLVDHRFRPAGTLAPGYLTERPGGGRADVAASASYEGSGWTVVLRRALVTGDPKDVQLVPGARGGVAFGLAVMDNTLFEHYASSTEERLVLLPADKD